MANDASAFFNWYRRYKVRAVDMNLFQQSMVETARGLSEGTLGAAVLQGFEVELNTGLLVDVSAGIASGPTGYLGVITDVSTVSVAAATGALPSRSLVVCRPLLVGANNIPSPTNPFNPVPLNTLQEAEIVVLPGTPSATPEYPAKGANDTILCGVVMPGGTSSLTANMLDFEVREAIGASSLISKNQTHFDDRLRPYRSTYKSLGIKSSQTVGSNPLLFCYPGKSSPSLFPLAGGVHVDDDTFVDFSTGVVSGGDTTTPDFAPTIPTAGNSIVCSVIMEATDTMSFVYGTQGTLNQCMNAIKNQLTAGAGSLGAALGAFVVCYVVVTSVSGTLSDIRVIDARPFLGGGSGSSQPGFVQEVVGVGNGTSLGFTLSKEPLSDGSLLVFFNGLYQTPDQWSRVGTTLTASPGVGVKVSVQYIADGVSPITGTQAVIGFGNGVITAFTFTGSPSGQGFVSVYKNGIYTPTDEWAYSQGLTTSQIVFNTPPGVGVKIAVVFYLPT